MFEIPDDDLFWNDDFPLDEFTTECETKTADNSAVLQSLPANVLTQDNSNQGLKKPEDGFNFKTAASLKTINAGSRGTNNCSYIAAPAEELSSVCKRKFPGPAGVLPPYSPELDKKSLDTSSVTDQQTSTVVGEPNNGTLFDSLPNVVEALPKRRLISSPSENPHQLSWSQGPADDVFASPQWKALVYDLGDDAQALLGTFSIKSSLLKANRKLLSRGKIPLIIGVMDNVEMQGSDASFVLRDPSGKMNGALHKDLFKEPATALQLGSVLVLRQVSVISPSSRTHYLNITPANVALVYTADREAVVSKRPWLTSQPLSCENKPTPTDSVVPSLTKIIEDSKQELFHSSEKNRHGLVPSSSPSSGLGEYMLNTGLGRGHTPSFSPRTPLAVQRHTNNCNPIGHFSKSNTGPPLFNSVPSLAHSAQTRTSNATTNFSHSVYNFTSVPSLAHSAQTRTSNATTNFSHSVYNFRQPVAKGNLLVDNSLDQCRSVCSLSAKAVRGSSTPDLQLKSEILSPIANNLLQINPTLDCGAAFQRKQGMDMNKTPPNLNQFPGEFSDSDDEVMLQMCDEALSQVIPEEHSNLNGSDFLACQRELNRDSGARRNQPISPNIINKAFEDCRNENQRIQSNCGDIIDYERSSSYSDAGDECTSARNSSSYLKNNTNNDSQASSQLADSGKPSNVVRKFSFKRSQPPTQTPLASKRPMFEVGNKITYNSAQSPFINRPGSLMVNSYLMPDEENKGHFPRSYVSASPVVNSSVSETVSSARPSTAAAFGAGARPTAPIVQLSNVNVSAATICSTDKFLHNKALTKSNEASERSSHIQSTRRCPDSSSADLMFPHWDNDLTDDFILSQLSDDF